MSIYASLMSLTDQATEYDTRLNELGAPYLDDTAGGYYYATEETLEQVQRGGFLDIAHSGVCALARVTVWAHDDASGPEATVFIDKRQAVAIRDALDQYIAAEPL